MWRKHQIENHQHMSGTQCQWSLKTNWNFLAPGLRLQIQSANWEMRKSNLHHIYFWICRFDFRISLSADNRPILCCVSEAESADCPPSSFSKFYWHFQMKLQILSADWQVVLLHFEVEPKYWAVTIYWDYRNYDGPNSKCNKFTCQSADRICRFIWKCQ